MAATPSPTPPVDFALREAFARYGPLLLHDRTLLEGELAADGPTTAADVALVLAALDEQVPQALLSVQGDEDAPRMAGRLEKRLRDRRGLNGYAAAWAVTAWARAVEAAPDRRTPSREPPPSPSGTVDGEHATMAATADPLVSLGALSSRRTSTDRTRRRSVIGAIAVVAAIATAIVATLSTDDPREERRRPVPRIAQGPDESRPSPAPTVAASTPVPAAPGTTAPPAPRIVGVVTGLPLLGDGKPHDVFVAFQAGRPDIVRVETRFVRGDAAWDPEPRAIEVPRSAIDRGTASAGRIALRTTRPARIVVEYVAVTQDGLRSAPFVKTFDFAPVSDCPANACGIVTGSRLVEGSSASDAYAAQVARALAIPVVTSRPRGRPDYEITVRLDDRSTRVVRRAAALPRGTHVRFVDDRLVAVASTDAAPPRP